MSKNGFVKKSVGTMTLGEKLKIFRNERRLGLNDVSRATKIPYHYLEFLEEGNYDKLPADVYVKGFLRNYAELLGVDDHIFIRLFEKEKGIRKNLKKKNGEKEEKIKPLDISSFVITPKIMAVAIIVILALAGIFYLYYEFGSFSGDPRLVILSPEKNYVTSGNSVTIEGVTDMDGKIFINDQPVLVDADGKFKENLTVQSGNSAVEIKAINRFGREVKENINIQSAFQEEAVSEEINEQTRVASQIEGVRIELRTESEPVWLSVETDGNLVFSGTMLTGAVQTFEAKEKITVNSGNGKATLVKFNGKEIGSLSQESGAVRGVIFTKDTKF